MYGTRVRVTHNKSLLLGLGHTVTLGYAAAGCLTQEVREATLRIIPTLPARQGRQVPYARDNTRDNTRRVRIERSSRTVVTSAVFL
jgi:hypothetical protein